MNKYLKTFNNFNKYKLFENPNEFPGEYTDDELDELEDDLLHFSVDAYAFALNSYGDLHVSNKGGTHDDFPDEYSILSGRIWPIDYRANGNDNNTIISFWDYPRSLVSLDKIIYKLNKKLNININKSNLIIEVFVNNEWTQYSYDNYLNNNNSSPSKPSRIKHTQSPLVKGYSGEELWNYYRNKGNK